MRYKRWLKKNAKSLEGKRVVLTGSTGGLGKEIALFLAYLKADLVLADRNMEKSNNLKALILKKYPSAKITQVVLDLESANSVKECVKTLESLESIDAIIHNAGVYSLPLEDGEDYNTPFKVNFLHPYFITKSLLNKLRNSSLARVIVVGSLAYKFARFNINDVDYNTSKSRNKIYGNSKRCLMLSLSELLKNEEKVKLSVVHPGVTPTNITRHFPLILRGIIKLPMKCVFISPKKASLSVILGLFKDVKYHDWLGPKIFGVWGKPKESNLKNITEEECKEIFSLAEEKYKFLAGIE